jgi:hypothetical protein
MIIDIVAIGSNRYIPRIECPDNIETCVDQAARHAARATEKFNCSHSKIPLNTITYLYMMEMACRRLRKCEQGCHRFEQRRQLIFNGSQAGVCYGAGGGELLLSLFFTT